MRIKKYRICKNCGIKKLLKSFPNKVCKANGKRYFGYRCNTCQYIIWKEKNADKIYKYMKKQRYKEDYTLDGRAMLLRNRCKARAKKYKYEFNLSKENIITKLKKGICEQTKIELVFNEDRFHPYAPSIDRIDNAKGYIDDNIQVVCTIYNFCKNQFSDKDVHDFIRRSEKQ